MSIFAFRTTVSQRVSVPIVQEAGSRLRSSTLFFSRNVDSSSCFRSGNPRRRLLSLSSHDYEKARVVVIGSGRMGHIRASLLQANPRFQVLGIADTNLASAQTLAETYGVSMHVGFMTLYANPRMLWEMNVPLRFSFWH